MAEASGAEPSALSTELPVAREGDFVIFWCGYSSISSAVLQQGGITNNRLGSFHHDELIGRPFGSKVMSKKGDAWLAMLRPTPELITQSLQHRTQIIYHADISLIISLLDVRPGKVVIEAGTGSGSLSTSLARAVQPGGRLHTFEFHEGRQQQAAEDFKRYGLEHVVASRHGDACKVGFPDFLHGHVDCVFLDLPAPWEAFPHADKCLVEGGRLCTFSPCIEQIERTAGVMREGHYQDIRMFESLACPWGVKAENQDAQGKKRKRQDGKQKGKGRGKGKGKKGREDDDEDDADAVVVAAQDGKAVSWSSFPLPMRGHTSYIMVATKAPKGELEAPA